MDSLENIPFEKMCHSIYSPLQIVLVCGLEKMQGNWILELGLLP